MPKHVMLSYQWDHQKLVEEVYNALEAQGLPVWMDIKGGMKGNINDRYGSSPEKVLSKLTKGFLC